MTSNQLAALKTRLTSYTPAFWNPPGYSKVSVPIHVQDVRKVFNRIDCLIHVCGRPVTETVWVSLETISGIQFEDLL